MFRKRKRERKRERVGRCFLALLSRVALSPSVSVGGGLSISGVRHGLSFFFFGGGGRARERGGGAVEVEKKRGERERKRKTNARARKRVEGRCLSTRSFSVTTLSVSLCAPLSSFFASASPPERETSTWRSRGSKLGRGSDRVFAFRRLSSPSLERGKSRRRRRRRQAKPLRKRLLAPAPRSPPSTVSPPPTPGIDLCVVLGPIRAIKSARERECAAHKTSTLVEVFCGVVFFVFSFRRWTSSFCITTLFPLPSIFTSFPTTSNTFLYFQHERKGSQGPRRQGPVVRKGCQGKSSGNAKCSSFSSLSFLLLLSSPPSSRPNPCALSNQLSNHATQGTLGAGKGATGDKKKPVSRSARAGLTFPVGRVHRQLKLRATANGRVGATAAVYSAAILGELCCFVSGRRRAERAPRKGRFESRGRKKNCFERNAKHGTLLRAFFLSDFGRRVPRPTLANATCSCWWRSLLLLVGSSARRAASLGARERRTQ